MSEPLPWFQTWLSAFLHKHNSVIAPISFKSQDINLILFLGIEKARTLIQDARKRPEPCGRGIPTNPNSMHMA